MIKSIEQPVENLEVVHRATKLSMESENQLTYKSTGEKTEKHGEH